MVRLAIVKMQQGGFQDGRGLDQIGNSFWLLERIR
jgi:hypothetical protein